MSDEQEKKGFELEELRDPDLFLDLGADCYAEVQEFKGKVRLSMRRWYQADDGLWYRTKNGLSLELADAEFILTHVEPLLAFMHRREAELK